MTRRICPGCGWTLPQCVCNLPTHFSSTEEESTEIVSVVEKICEGCDEQFWTTNNSEFCYNCTLARVCGDGAPEEGDFNTAAILSGTLTDEEWRTLQADLAAVEQGKSTAFPWG